MDGTDVSSKKAFSVQMEAEYKGLFASAGAYSKTEGGTSSRNQTKSTSTSVIVHGGSQEIASILADAYSPTFKDEFKHWLKTIPHYPKAFRFLMGPITDLVNFRADDLFPNEPTDWACDGLVNTLQTEITRNGNERFYYINDTNPNSPVKVYCDFNSRQSLEDAIARRRSGLKRAIDVYLEEVRPAMPNHFSFGLTRIKCTQFSMKIAPVQFQNNYPAMLILEATLDH